MPASRPSSAAGCWTAHERRHLARRRRRTPPRRAPLAAGGRALGDPPDRPRPGRVQRPVRAGGCRPRACRHRHARPRPSRLREIGRAARLGGALGGLPGRHGPCARGDPLERDPDRPARSLVRAWRRLAVPTLVIQGGQDTIVPPEASAPMAELPVVERVVYPALRHELFNEPEGEQVLGEVVGWIRRQAAVLRFPKRAEATTAPATAPTATSTMSAGESRSADPAPPVGDGEGPEPSR